MFSDVTKKYVCLPLICLLLTIGTAWAGQYTRAPQEKPILQGNIRESIYTEAFKPAAVHNLTKIIGYVTQADTKQAMIGVTVQVPALNFTTATDKEGRFYLPQLPNKPTIIGFTKQGYTPQTVTLDARSKSPLVISLREVRQTVVLDNQIRHLGDNSYSPISAGAWEFRKPAENTTLIKHFSLNRPIQGRAFLEIGSVIGLDTEAAHRLGQSAFHRVSTPMIVRLNGQLLTYVTTNGDGLRIPFTAEQTNPTGMNTLEIITGYQTPDGAYIDYDDIELMLLTLDY